MIVCETPQSVAHLCVQVCDDIWMALHGEKAPATHVALMLGTAAAESHFTLLKGSESALGLWRVDPRAAIRMFDEELRYGWLSRKGRKRWQAFTWAWLRLKSLPYFRPSNSEIRSHLLNDDAFGCVMARWKYLMLSEPIPETLADLSMYWYHYHNQYDAEGAKCFIDAWHNCLCYNLMSLHGYERSF